MVKRFIISIVVSLALFVWQFYDHSLHQHIASYFWDQLNSHFLFDYDIDSGHDSSFDGFNHQYDFEKCIDLLKFPHKLWNGYQLSVVLDGYCRGPEFITKDKSFNHSLLPDD